MNTTIEGVVTVMDDRNDDVEQPMPLGGMVILTLVMTAFVISLCAMAYLAYEEYQVFKNCPPDVLMRFAEDYFKALQKESEHR